MTLMFNSLWDWFRGRKRQAPGGLATLRFQIHRPAPLLTSEPAVLAAEDGQPDVLVEREGARASTTGAAVWSILAATAADFIRKLAPAELGHVPIYIVPQSTLPSELGGNSKFAGHHYRGLDLDLQNHLGAAWRGRGVAMVLNDSLILAKGKYALSALCGHVIHEAAHAIVARSYAADPEASAPNRSTEWLELEPTAADLRHRELAEHDANYWLRTMLHLVWRAYAVQCCYDREIYLGLDGVHGYAFRSLAALRAYYQAILDDAQRMAGEPFDVILARPVPVAFRDLWLAELSELTERHKGALALEVS
jgi:hypothetical protein